LGEVPAGLYVLEEGGDLPYLDKARKSMNKFIRYLKKEFRDIKKGEKDV